MNTSTQQRFFNYMQEANLSIRVVSRKLGVSPAQISFYRKGTAEENRLDVPALETKIERWLAHEEQRQGALIVPELTLAATRDIATACDIAHTGRTIAVVCGPAGSGKTTALRAYQQHNNGAMLVEVDQSFTLPILAQEICRVIGTSEIGSVAVLTKRIESHLGNMDALVIFDECDYLTARCLEWIRRVIHDKAHCGVILCGLPRLEIELQNNKNMHDQLVSRVGYIVRVHMPGKGDLGKIIDSVWVLAPPHRKKLVEHSKGSFRQLRNIMAIASIVAKKDNTKIPQLEHIDEAIDGVLSQQQCRIGTR